MAQIAFDSLEYYEKLISAAVPEAQAKVQVEALQAALHYHDWVSRRDLATKDDIHALRMEIQDVRQEVQDVRQELGKEIQDVRQEVQDVRQEVQKVRMDLGKEMADTKHEILKWLIMAIVGQTGVIIAIIALIKNDLLGF